MDDHSTNRIASIYLAFAEREAHGRSTLYETLARGVAADSAARSFLAELPPAKQQPNLLFAAVKYLYGMAADWGDFRRLLLEHGDEIRDRRLAHDPPEGTSRRLQGSDRLPCFPCNGDHGILGEWRNARARPNNGCA